MGFGEVMQLHRGSRGVIIMRRLMKRPLSQRLQYVTCPWIFETMPPTNTWRKPTFQFLLKCDFQRHFSDWNVLNGRHISVTIQLTFIADQSPISNFLLRNKNFNYLSLNYAEKNSQTVFKHTAILCFAILTL